MLENLFNLLKGKGLFIGYKDYDEWCEKKYGAKPKQKFKETLSKKDRKNFDFIFGEDYGRNL